MRTAIERLRTTARMSQAVIHGDIVYLAGQVGTPYGSVTAQTSEILGKVDDLLAEVGSGRDRLLRTEIWLDDMRDFEAMNAVWDGWMPDGHAPARACGEARLARPGLWVEIIVTAAL